MHRKCGLCEISDYRRNESRDNADAESHKAFANNIRVREPIVAAEQTDEGHRSATVYDDACPNAILPILDRLQRVLKLKVCFVSHARVIRLFSERKLRSAHKSLSN
jgi:hypothetical protein